MIGDPVNYGPNPAEVVEFVRANAQVVVRGNHDHAAGFGEDPRASRSFREMAEVMLEFTNSVLSASQKQFLRNLPVKASREVDGLRALLCHAVPSEPLYTYCPPDSARWEVEAKLLEADVLLVGHTHLPFIKMVGQKRIVNPGSLGQPKTGRPLACYAV